MKSVVALLCLAAFAAAHNDGQWRGEGLAESQDSWGKGYGVYGAWNGAYNGLAYAANNEGQWRGEGLLESQDNWSRNNYAYNGYNAYNGAYGYAGQWNDGQWKGEGLAESQDNHGRWNSWNGVAAVVPSVAYAAAPVYATGYAAAAPAYATGYYAGSWAHGAAPIGHDGRVVDTPEVAHAKAAHFAAKAAATNGAYGAHAVAVVPAYAGAYAHGAAPIGHDGRVVDTPEVAHAKQAHFAAKAAAAHGSYAGHY